MEGSFIRLAVCAAGVAFSGGAGGPSFYVDRAGPVAQTFRMDQNDVQRMADMLAGAGNGPGIPMRRCLCQKMLRQDEHERRIYSGVVNYSEILCEACRRDHGTHARVVCLRCRRLIGFMEPYEDRVTKFRMLPRAHYHVDGCPFCMPGVTHTPICEHVRHCRQRGIPIRQDLDLVQEIEQKGLQGEREAAKLRAAISRDEQCN